MKLLRYSLLLPLIHIAISLPVLYYEEAMIWRQISRIQVIEDYEKTASPPIVHSGPMIAWNPCYEYRASTADGFIFFVEFPAGLLIPPHGAAACNPTLLQPILQKLKRWMQVKTRILLLDSLLIIGIAGQWWLVGRWIDRLRQRRQHVKRWIIPVATITISGILVAAASFGSADRFRFAAALLSVIAILAWLGLLVTFVVAAAQSAQLNRKSHAEYG